MNNTVCFRDFEERDIDFIYKCKNDEKLNSMIVGDFYPFTYDEAVKWVRGCMGEHESFKFWAIATNDDEKRIVGWASISGIDHVNKKACGHGIVIADPDYKDGMAFIECHLFLLKYVFEILHFNRYYGESLVGHKDSNFMEEVMFLTIEGVRRQAYFKNGRFYDSHITAILKDDYFAHKENGDYSIASIIKRIAWLLKNRK